MGEPERRRRRLRPPSGDAAPAPSPPPPSPPAASPPAAAGPAEPGPRPAPRPPAGNRPTSGAGTGSEEREAERGLRGLVGSGSSQVSVGAALRARDAARPTEAHLAEAEQRLVIVRRNWSPREDLPRR